MPAEHRASLRTLRIKARGPRIACTIACGLLTLAGLRSTISPAAAPHAQPAVVATAVDPAVPAFAEAFARVYLTFGRDDTARRQRQLAPFLGEDLDPDAGLQPGRLALQRATWVTTEAVKSVAESRWLVTVVVATNRDDLLYVAVPVTRVPTGGLAVSDYPSLVGAPPRAARSPSSDPAELTDQALADVATRAIGNYLRGARQNLRADLAPGATVTTPSIPLDLTSVESLGWSDPGRVLSATLAATDATGTRMRMRFLLSVVKRDRWYVSAINNPTPPAPKGPTP